MLAGNVVGVSSVYVMGVHGKDRGTLGLKHPSHRTPSPLPSAEYSSEGRFFFSLCLMVTWISGLTVQPHIQVLSVSGHPPSCPAGTELRRVFSSVRIQAVVTVATGMRIRGHSGGTAPCGTQETGGRGSWLRWQERGHHSYVIFGSSHNLALGPK